MVLQAVVPRCPCGLHGCLEALRAEPVAGTIVRDAGRPSSVGQTFLSARTPQMCRDSRHALRARPAGDGQLDIPSHSLFRTFLDIPLRSEMFF